MTEQYLQRKIIKMLEKKGAYVVKVISASRRGVPDIIFCLNGRFGAVEVKAPGKIKNVSVVQDININKIINSGGAAIVADSTETVHNFIKSYQFNT